MPQLEQANQALVAKTGAQEYAPHVINTPLAFLIKSALNTNIFGEPGWQGTMMITDAGTLVRTRVSEISIVGRNTQGVILIRTAEDENVVGLQRVAEPVDEEDLDTIDGSAAEGDDEIAPEVDVDDEPEEE